jgi:hypothetical protein
MAQTDAFALQNSSLNAFLFAEIGTEPNGTNLTMLTVLARLGFDPWAEAARWVGLPKAAVTDRVVGSLAQMKLSPQAVANIRATAARLVLLLPNQVGPVHAEQPRTILKWTAPKPRTLVIICCALAFAILASVLLFPNPGAPAPIAHINSKSD